MLGSQNRPEPKSGVIADARAIFRGALRSLLVADGRVRLAGDAATGGQLLAAIARHLPDFVCIGLPLRGAPAELLLEEVRRVSPTTRVIVLVDGGYRSAAQRLAVARGDVLLATTASPGAVLAAVHGDQRNWPRSRGSGESGLLSPRQIEVLGLAAIGLTNEGISRSLEIRPATVKRHLAESFERLGVHSRVAAINRAVAEGLLAPPIQWRVEEPERTLAALAP